MSKMFGFLLMMGNYKERKVGRFDDESKGIMVSTAFVNDSDKPYETAVAHPAYNKGEMVIVELYNTKEEAATGHDKWVNIITGENLPESLTDVSTAEIAKFCELISGRDKLTYVKKSKKGGK
jgi:hypothetical protein